MSRNSDLTPNFHLSEFIRVIDEVPDDDILDNIIYLSHRLQVVRDIIGKPIIITSGYRTPQHNEAVGGKPNSYHLKGMAADMVVVGMTPKEFQKQLAGWSGGMGEYNTFTHLDIRDERARWS